jgi:hypothetical protein
MRIPYISLLAAGALSLGGCAYDGLGMGYGDPYYSGYGYGSPYYGYGYGSPYGYGRSGVSISIGSGYSPYGYGGYYGGYGGYGYGGYGYGSPYYGWYNNYYYPGTGYYVYDVNRTPYPMTSTQRQYWSSRSPALRTGTTTTTRVQPNWSGFNRRTATYTDRQTAREDRQTAREQRRLQREQRRKDNSGY